MPVAILHDKTTLAKKGTIQQRWFVVDASGIVLGRLASDIAMILMGKHKPIYTPHVDTGDYVIVVNAEKVKITGKKLEQEAYDYYTYYPGGHKHIKWSELLEKRPERLIELAVRRMLPKNKLGRKMLKKLKVYRGPMHPHQAQKPIALDLTKGLSKGLRDIQQTQQ